MPTKLVIRKCDYSIDINYLNIHIKTHIFNIKI